MSDIDPEVLKVNIDNLFSRLTSLEMEVRASSGLDDRVKALEETVASLAGKIADLS